MIEQVRVGDTVLVSLSTERAYQGVVMAKPDHDVFIVDRLQRGVLVQFVLTPDDLAGVKKPNPVWHSTTYWCREEDIQAI